MRASLFLSALFVATLAGGTALAEKPEKAKQERVTNPRSRGDSVDGSGRHVARARSERSERTVVQSAGKVEAATMLKTRGAAERVRCSEAQDDCGRGGTAKAGASKDASGKTTKDQAAKSDKKVVTREASAASAAKAAMLMKLMSAKCGARARGGCSGHDDPW